MSNYLFVYPQINYKKEGTNIYRFDASSSLENYFEVKNNSFLNNNEQIKISKKIYEYIHRHIGTWQRWLSNEEDEINKYRELHRLVFKILFWLKEKKISKVIQFTGAPHHVDTVLIEIASRVYGIKSSFFYFEEVLTKTYLPMIRYEFQFKHYFIEKLKNSDPNIRKVISIFQERVQSKKKADWIPISYFYKKNITLAFIYILLWHFKKKFLDIYSSNNHYREIGLYGDIKSLFKQKKYLNSISKEIKLNRTHRKIKKNNIIIYGHYQPESTTLSEGGDFRDQIEILKFLKHSGYSDNIFYKEHKSSFLYIDKTIGPTRVGLWKNENFLKNLKNYNAQLIFDDSDIDNPIIITCTGSIAIERSLQGLKTIICGYPWYGEIPGSVRLENVKWTDQEDLDSLKNSSKNIKKEAEIFLHNILSYGLYRDHNQKNIEFSNFHTISNFLDLFLET